MPAEEDNAQPTQRGKLDQRFEIQVLPNRVVRATVGVKLLRADVARPFCTGIQQAAQSTHACGLVIDLNTLGRATPAAGIYAISQIKSLVVERIALVGGNAFMRSFARMVLTLGRFGHFAFFESEPEAVSWAAGGSTSISDQS